MRRRTPQGLSTQDSLLNSSFLFFSPVKSISGKPERMVPRTTAATPPTQLEQLDDATQGFQSLLDNDLPKAKLILGSSTSPFHLLGAGLCTFLAAALGQEDKELFASLALLSKAEEAAIAQSVAKRGKGEPAPVFPVGLEYKVSWGQGRLLGRYLTAVHRQLLVADSVICQALVHGTFSA